MSEDINKLRADYKELVGKNPFAGWDASELQRRIDAALNGSGSQGDGDGPKTDGNLVPVKLLRDVWGEEGDRLPKGDEIDLPLDFAKQLIEEGKAKRNDPLPGDSK